MLRVTNRLHRHLHPQGLSSSSLLWLATIHLCRGEHSVNLQPTPTTCYLLDSLTKLKLFMAGVKGSF